MKLKLSTWSSRAWEIYCRTSEVSGVWCNFLETNMMAPEQILAISMQDERPKERKQRLIATWVVYSKTIRKSFFFFTTRRVKSIGEYINTAEPAIACALSCNPLNYYINGCLLDNTAINYTTQMIEDCVVLATGMSETAKYVEVHSCSVVEMQALIHIYQRSEEHTSELQSQR